MTKHLRLTLVRIGREELTADVTLALTKTHVLELWMASSVVEIGEKRVEHSTGGHLTERTALLVIADWLRMRFGASSTRLKTGSSVTLVAITAAS